MADIVSLTSSRSNGQSSNGHGRFSFQTPKNLQEAVKFRVTEAELRALDVLVASREIPMLTRSDFCRYGLSLAFDAIQTQVDPSLQVVIRVVQRQHELDAHHAMYEREDGVLKSCERAVKDAQTWHTEHLAEAQIRAAAEDVTIPEVRKKILALLSTL